MKLKKSKETMPILWAYVTEIGEVEIPHGTGDPYVVMSSIILGRANKDSWIQVVSNWHGNIQIPVRSIIALKVI